MYDATTEKVMVFFLCSKRWYRTWLNQSFSLNIRCSLEVESCLLNSLLVGKMSVTKYVSDEVSVVKVSGGALSVG